nr:InlB B-repeat-containing protein [bacterium]
MPSEPQRANSTFTGWYVSGADTKYDFTENITAPVELYAKYDCDE